MSSNNQLQTEVTKKKNKTSPPGGNSDIFQRNKSNEAWHEIYWNIIQFSLKKLGIDKDAGGLGF